MALGYGKQCKACNSQHRAEIDRRLLDGQSVREVSRWLKSIGESISHESVAAHRRAHLAVIEEAKTRLGTPPAEKPQPAAEQTLTVVPEPNDQEPRGRGHSKQVKPAKPPPPAAQSQIEKVAPEFEKAVEKVVADVNLLDDLASTAVHVVRNMAPQAAGGTLDMPSVILFNGCMKEAREAVKSRHELLEGKKVNVDDLGGLAELLALGFGQKPPGSVEG